MAPRLPIYMDNHATTPVDPRVLEAMLPYFTEKFGNAASKTHSFGWAAEAAVDTAREKIAALLGGEPREIVFTSGATESNNLALKGAVWAHRSRGNHVVTVATEHKAVLDCAKRLEREGTRVTLLPVDAGGRVSPAAVADAVGDDTVVVSVMLANNEVGVVQDIAAIGAAVKDRNEKTLFHCDAAQGAGKVPFDVNEARVDLVSLSAHKMYGPKGVGALWVRRRPRVRIASVIDGGGHERGMRSGTLNVPAIVGFGKACEIALATREDEARRVGALRDRLEDGILRALPGVTVNGSRDHRLPGNLNLSFAGVEAEGLMMALRDVAVSSGSACTSASLEPSYVLRALGVDDDLAHSSIRFGLGRFNTEEEVDYVIDLVTRKVTALREKSPTWRDWQEKLQLAQ